MKYLAILLVLAGCGRGCPPSKAQVIYVPAYQIKDSHGNVFNCQVEPDKHARDSWDFDCRPEAI